MLFPRKPIGVSGVLGCQESMMIRTGRAAGFMVTAATAALVAACASSATDAVRTPASISIVTGSNQSGFAGLTLSQPLVVKVTSANGAVVAGQTVDFAVTSGQATVNPASATTGVDGTAKTQVTLGANPGSVMVVATVRATTLNAVFTETAQPLTTDFSCTGVTPVTLAVGEVRTSLSGTGICLHADATSEYLVNAFHGSTVFSAQTQVGIAGFGITTPTSSAPLGSTANRVLPGGLLNVGSASDPRRALDLRMRNAERRELAPRMAAARLARRSGALRAIAPAPPTVGQILQLNVDEDCNTPSGTQPHYRYGRVAAITTNSIVVADTSNPANGFTDAEYNALGVTFDTLVDPLDKAAFGNPTDIDANGRIIIFYTSAVNALTPAKSQGIIEGFFNPRDLFPKTAPATATVQGCNASNFAEMFYVLVPDPAGTINGNVRTKAEVQQVTVAVLAHEYQHLINASRRLYVTNANDFEEVWLNEGLSHIAEELLYYHAAGLTPQQNIDGTSVRTTQKRVDAFNQYQTGNFGRYQLFLQNPTVSSPYADNDSLANRGAIWCFLRYAADHHGSPDGTVWQQLVNSPTIGMANLTNVFGANILNQIRDWSISVYTDDLVATTPAYQEPSWNFRSLYPLLGATTYPLSVIRLSNGAQTTQTLSGGGSLYTTFDIQAGVTGAVAWTVASPNVQISIVRTK